MRYWCAVSPSIVSGVLLGAHFLRSGSVVPAVLCLAGPAAAAASKRDWAVDSSRFLMCVGLGRKAVTEGLIYDAA